MTEVHSLLNLVVMDEANRSYCEAIYSFRSLHKPEYFHSNGSAQSTKKRRALSFARMPVASCPMVAGTNLQQFHMGTVSTLILLSLTKCSLSTHLRASHFLQTPQAYHFFRSCVLGRTNMAFGNVVREHDNHKLLLVSSELAFYCLPDSNVQICIHLSLHLN